MRYTIIALALTTASVFSGPTSSALAQNAKVARGTVAAIAGQFVTVKVGDHDLKFSVDSKTTVEVRGGATKSSRAAAAGKSGPQLAEVLQAGQAVAVTYSDMAGVLHATAIKVIPTAPGSSAEANAAMASTGIVKSIGADWITISGTGGGGSSFEQTFKIDPGTKLFAKGGSTATAANGGKVGFDRLVASGDHVSVSYHKQGDTLLASRVLVTMKAAH